MNTPKFSCVLITKNEANTLPKLMESLKDFRERGGEVCITDTGSTDGTAEIAKNYGCKVTEVGEKFIKIIDEDTARAINERFVVDGEEPIVKAGNKLFDFAAARNHATSLASNDFIITLDADEAYTRFDIDKLDALVEEGWEGFQYQFVYAHTPDGRAAVQFVQSKAFDRRKMRWEGCVHECLLGEAKLILLDESIIKLEHFQEPNKDHRGNYLVGLALDCFENQDKDRQSHYLGREMLWTARPKSAIKELKRHLLFNGWQAEKAQSMIFIGDAYGMIGQEDEQLNWYHKAFDLDPNRRESLMRIASFYRNKNNHRATIAFAKAALEIPWTDYYANNKYDYEEGPHALLYHAYGWLGDIASAQTHILKALEYQPYNPKYLHDTNYYFEYGAKEIEGWMTFPELQFLYNMAKKMDTICEIGSWKGRSTNALLSGCKGRVTAVDTFLGSAGEDAVHAEYVKNDGVYKDFLNNTKDFKNLKINREDSLIAASQYKDKSFDAVFIDAEHTEEGYRKDIRAWKGKAKVMLCGHDYCSAWPGVMHAVDTELGGPDEIHGSVWVKWINKPLVSIVIPTLGRPEKLNRLLKSIKENAGYDNYEILVGEDQLPPNNIGVPKMVKELVDRSEGKMVMFLGNDCIMEKDCLLLAVTKMYKEFPAGDGLVGINDNYWTGEFYTHWLASKKLLPFLGGEFFYTGYFHTGCDNELVGRCRKIGKAVWAEEAKIIHDHPVLKGFKHEDMDDVYRLAYQTDRMTHDKALLEQRSKDYGFELHGAFGTPRREPVVHEKLNLRTRLPEDCKNMKVLNVGIGAMTSTLMAQLPFMRFQSLTHLEIHEPYIENAKKQIWDSKTDYILGDVAIFDNFEDYDLILIFDVLEHLKKEDSLRIIQTIKNLGKKLLVFGPLEDELMNERTGTDFIESQEHLSLWIEEDFKSLDLKTELVPGLHHDKGKTWDALWASYYDEIKIPKRVFTIWLNNDPVIPEEISKYIETHKMPGWEHKLITLENCFKESEYLKGCINAKKWAKAADYLRIWYLYTEGGVYLDADTEVLRPLTDNFLKDDLFACREKNGFIANGMIGSIKGHPLLKEYLARADARSFEEGEDEKVFEYGMEIWTQLLDGSNAKIYPEEVFMPWNHQTGVTNMTENTFTYHHSLKSWL